MITLRRDVHPGFGRLVRDALVITKGPLPVARMVRTGASIAAAFGLFLAAGELDGAVLCALSTNLLLFVDQGGPLPERLAVIAAGGLAIGAAGAVGALASGSAPLVLGGIFGIAAGAGLVHSSLPGVEMIPRQALIAFVVCAYLPQITGAAALCVVVGTGCALAGAGLDSMLRSRVLGPRLREARAKVIWPGLAFGLLYGTVAVLGLLSGTVFDSTRPYWVTVTTLVVMQPGRRASALRALQRLLGTLDGVVVVYGLALLFEGSAGHLVLLGAAFVLPFLWPLGFARNYGFGVAVISTWILILLDLAQPGEQAHALFIARLWDTALGCLLAVLGTVLAHVVRTWREARPPAPPNASA